MSYHFKNSRTSVNKDEPVFLTKFIATFVLPEALRQQYGSEVMTEQIKRVGGLTTDKLPEPVEQAYRFHKRRFIGSVVETNVDVEMEFEVNQDENNVMYPYNILRDWVRIGYDSNTGFQGLKRDYSGSSTIEQHDKVGNVLRRYYFPIYFPITPPNEMELAYLDEAIYSLTITFAGENHEDISY